MSLNYINTDSGAFDKVFLKSGVSYGYLSTNGTVLLFNGSPITGVSESGSFVNVNGSLVSSPNFIGAGNTIITVNGSDIYISGSSNVSVTGQTLANPNFSGAQDISVFTLNNNVIISGDFLKSKKYNYLINHTFTSGNFPTGFVLNQNSSNFVTGWNSDGAFVMKKTGNSEDIQGFVTRIDTNNPWSFEVDYAWKWNSSSTYPHAYCIFKKENSDRLLAFGFHSDKIVRASRYNSINSWNSHSIQVDVGVATGVYYSLKFTNACSGIFFYFSPIIDNYDYQYLGFEPFSYWLDANGKISGGFAINYPYSSSPNVVHSYIKSIRIYELGQYTSGVNFINI